MPSVVAPQSVGRIFAVLELLAGQTPGSAPRPGMKLSALARACGAPKASLLTLLSGMVETGYLVHDAGGYRPGPRLRALSLRLAAGVDFTDVARPVMNRLVETTGETVLLGIATPDGNRATYIAKVESANPVRYTVTLGDQRELYCTAVGKMLLAWRGKREIDRYLAAHRLQAFTPKTIVDRGELIKELARIRAERLSESREERMLGASGMAVPVVRPSGELAAVLTLSGPTERMRTRRREFLPRVREAGEELSRILAEVPGMQIPASPT